MADKLLVRAYNVQVGDCFYVRIPGARKSGGQIDDFHILIDCGSVGDGATLKDAIENLEEMLPEADDGRKRLDLLVATHEHKDHIAGFDPDAFANIKIEHIWLSAAMDPEHPQAERSLRLHNLATTAMRQIASQNLALSPELQELVAVFGISNDGAMKALRKDLPDASGIEPTYVHAGMSKAKLGLSTLHGGTIKVLNPDRDIDRFYLGEEADTALRGLAATTSGFRADVALSAVRPANISASDFLKLRSRMMSSVFAFAEFSSKVTNNTSVVLLIEWRGKRLLFVGDAEWDTQFEEGKYNGAWNVMWKQRKADLNAPIDFLKIGHHGSENATPWNDREDGEVTEPNTILDAILPLPRGNGRPKAQAIVSTMRKNYKTIPRAALLVEIGKRVRNVRNYETELGDRARRELPKYREYEEQWLDEPQPKRTDCEFALNGVGFVDIEIGG